MSRDTNDGSVIAIPVGISLTSRDRELQKKPIESSQSSLMGQRLVYASDPVNWDWLLPWITCINSNCWSELWINMYCLGQKKRAELEEQKKKAMEEAERKRQEASDGKGKGKGPAIDAHKEISKTKEQVEEEMKISLSFRIKPLDLEAMDSDELKDKATELFNTILLLETEKYDCEQRRVNQDYELKELKERQKVQLRQKAA